MSLAIIAGLSSDIGSALATQWQADGWEIQGPYRRANAATARLHGKGARMVECDFSDSESVSRSARELSETARGWDVLVICIGRLDPVGPFEQVSIDRWESALYTNMLGPLRFVHDLLPARRREGQREPCVIFFAGGGTNSAPVNSSSYILSKIGLMKMTELLDAEVADVRFVIIGPGWVRTKIHDATLEAGADAGENLAATQRRFEEDDFVPMSKIIACCDWAVRASRKVVGGRNISAEFDAWGHDALSAKLESCPDMYKLRRSGNDWTLQLENELT
jgi:NAD(P)-dependent dehydrogenase (short-subunit alcohol dehydrogenase family)